MCLRARDWTRRGTAPWRDVTLLLTSAGHGRVIRSVRTTGCLKGTACTVATCRPGVGRTSRRLSSTQPWQPAAGTRDSEGSACCGLGRWWVGGIGLGGNADGGPACQPGRGLGRRRHRLARCWPDVSPTFSTCSSELCRVLGHASGPFGRLTF